MNADYDASSDLASGNNSFVPFTGANTPRGVQLEDKAPAQSAEALVNSSDKSAALDAGTGYESIYDSYEGYENFMHSFGLKPWDADDVEEGQRIAESMLAEDEEDEEGAYNQNEDGSYRGKGSVYHSFGGYENFMHSYGLKPWDDDDIDEGALIVDVLEAHSRNAAQHDSQKK